MAVAVGSEFPLVSLPSPRAPCCVLVRRGFPQSIFWLGSHEFDYEAASSWT